MITELQIYILALVQGITEFLPISSSGHLVLTSQVFGWADQGLLIDVAVHVGTLGAVMVYLWRDIASIIMGIWYFMRSRNHAGQKLLVQLVVGTIPLVIVGFLIKDHIHHLRTVETIAYATIGFGLLLWVIDRFTMTVRYTEHLGHGSVLFIGLMQCLAFIPGTSRSGITITAGRLLSMDRQESARFAMLLSIPAIIASGTLLALDIVEQQGELVIAPVIWHAMGIAFVTALAFIAFMMSWVRSSSFGIFIAYRLLLGGALLWWVHDPETVQHYLNIFTTLIGHPTQ